MNRPAQHLGTAFLPAVVFWRVACISSGNISHGLLWVGCNVSIDLVVFRIGEAELQRRSHSANLLRIASAYNRRRDPRVVQRPGDRDDSSRHTMAADGPGLISPPRTAMRVPHISLLRCGKPPKPAHRRCSCPAPPAPPRGVSTQKIHSRHPMESIRQRV